MSSLDASSLSLESETARMLFDPALDESILADERKACRQSLRYFCLQHWDEVPGTSKLVWNWHLDLFCDELQKVAERVFKGLPREYDLVLNVSPGTSKSTFWSILFPCWVWTRMPSARILTASHTDDLVLDLANKARTVIKSDKYRQLFPEIVLREDQDTKGYYANTLGGDRKTCTVAGKSPMGFHAHFIIPDDPIDPKKVLSEAELVAAKEFMVNFIPTRKVDKLVTVTLLVMQRLGLRDPTDVMLDEAKKEGAIPVRHICLPAELDRNEDGSWSNRNVNPPELTKRYINGLMDPFRLSREALSQYKARPHYYSTQFGQQPYDLMGGMFQSHWFNRRVKAAPYHARRVRSWDRASTFEGGCYTAGVLMAMDDDKNLYVEHVEHGQWEPNERNQRMLAAAQRDRARYGPKHEPEIWVEEEGGSTAKDARMNLVKAMAGFNVRFYHPTGSKDVRAEPWACQLAAGIVCIVEDGTWDVAGYVQEHVAFKPEPGKRLGKYKDQVDASSDASAKLTVSNYGVGSFRVLGPRKQKGLRVIACSRSVLAEMPVAEQGSLLVDFVDPGEDRFPNSLPAGGMRDGIQETIPSDPPTHSLAKLLGFLRLSFAPIDPADHQQTWDQSVKPWGRKASEVMMNDSHGKKLWSFLLGHKGSVPDLWVFCDSGDGRAMSAAMAACDVMMLDRKKSLWSPSEPDRDWSKEKPLMKHVFDCVKAGRAKVVF